MSKHWSVRVGYFTHIKYDFSKCVNISNAMRFDSFSNPERASNPFASGAHPPELVAEKIVSAIRRNKARILVGFTMLRQ